MPYHDGTGPFGDGRPGRGLGPCGRFGVPVRGGLGRGFGRGMGFRQGFGRRGWIYNNEMPVNDSVYSYDKDTLQQEKSRLEKLISWVNERLADIEK